MFLDDMRHLKVQRRLPFPDGQIYIRIVEPTCHFSDNCSEKVMMNHLLFPDGFLSINMRLLTNYFSAKFALVGMHQKLIYASRNFTQVKLCGIIGLLNDHPSR